MKRTCYMGRRDTCRALDQSGNQYRCWLGYKIAQDWNPKLGISMNPRPLQICPKPKTYREYDDLRNERAPAEAGKE